MKELTNTQIVTKLFLIFRLSLCCINCLTYTWVLILFRNVSMALLGIETLLNKIEIKTGVWSTRTFHWDKPCTWISLCLSSQNVSCDLY